QPVIFDDPSRTITSYGARPTVYSFEVESGPNLLAEKLADFVTFKNVARFGTVKDDLDKIIDQFNNGADMFLPVRDVVTATSEANGLTDSTHGELIKLWAADQVGTALLKNETNRAAQTAVTYRIVTPVSGAVVLETAQQFKNFGLKPGEDPTVKQSGKNGEPVFQDAADVPSVPEPEMWLMMFIIGFLLVIQNRKTQLVAMIRRSESERP
ncbi:hypothetical protein KF707_19985, partial [Candidatus Obscuribacterales bacterium]|nr:hypothetical protein [Candidatus Obscuribacterales bacterium]